MTIEPPLYDEIVAFWRDAGPKAWFAKDEAFDAEIRTRFEAAHLAAARGEFADWMETAGGSLGLLLLIDQFPRNLYRDSAHAFATDPMARQAAAHAVAQDFHMEVEPLLRPFFILPFEHSEDIADQDCAVVLLEAHARDTGDEETLKWAKVHRDIIERFGRFPHRNAVMGRVTTPEEQAYMDEGGFKG